MMDVVLHALAAPLALIAIMSCVVITFVLYERARRDGFSVGDGGEVVEPDDSASAPSAPATTSFRIITDAPSEQSMGSVFLVARPYPGPGVVPSIIATRNSQVSPALLERSLSESVPLGDCQQIVEYYECDSNVVAVSDYVSAEIRVTNIMVVLSDPNTPFRGDDELVEFIDESEISSLVGEALTSVLAASPRVKPNSAATIKRVNSLCSLMVNPDETQFVVVSYDVDRS